MLFSGWNPAAVIGLVAVLSGPAIAMTAIIAAHLRKAHQTELETTLKHEMLQQGMSAGEIEQVIKASSRSR